MFLPRSLCGTKVNAGPPAVHHAGSHLSRMCTLDRPTPPFPELEEGQGLVGQEVLGEQPRAEGRDAGPEGGSGSGQGAGKEGEPARRMSRSPGPGPEGTPTAALADQGHRSSASCLCPPPEICSLVPVGAARTPRGEHLTVSNFSET